MRKVALEIHFSLTWTKQLAPKVLRAARSNAADQRVFKALTCREATASRAEACTNGSRDIRRQAELTEWAGCAAQKLATGSRCAAHKSALEDVLALQTCAYASDACAQTDGASRAQARQRRACAHRERDHGNRKCRADNAADLAKRGLVRLFVGNAFKHIRAASKAARGVRLDVPVGFAPKLVCKPLCKLSGLLRGIVPSSRVHDFTCGVVHKTDI